MAELNVLARGVEVQEQVATSHHGVQEKAGNKLLDLFFLPILHCCLFRDRAFQLSHVFELEKDRVDGDGMLLLWRIFVAVQQLCQ